MRSVSWAICTLVLPVSRSPAPYSAVSSRLRSLVRVIGPPNGSRRADRPCPGDVLAHCLDQLRGALEAPLTAQPLEEAQAQLAAVQVALPVDQVRLDQLRPATA